MPFLLSDETWGSSPACPPSAASASFTSSAFPLFALPELKKKGRRIGGMRRPGFTRYKAVR